MLELLALFGRDITDRLIRGDMTVNKFYNQLYFTIALVATAILVLSFVSDVAGYNWVNIVIIPIWVLAVLWIKFYPKAVVGIIAVTASATGLTVSLKDGYEKWDHFTKHAMLFGGVFGLTRFLVPIKAYPFMGLLLLGALITLGIYAWVWPTGKAYKRYVLGIVLVAIAIGLFGVITGKSTSDGLSDLTKKIGKSGGISLFKKASADAYGWDLIETINCPMGRASWEKGRGWCTSQMKLEPGTYRLLLKEALWDAAFWDPVSQRVTEYRAVPPQGIPLSEWQNNPTYVRTFLKDAPVGNNRRFGSVVAKIEGKSAFDPFQKGSFEIEDATALSIGPNIPFCDIAFIHNRGMIVVEIEKEM